VICINLEEFILECKANKQRIKDNIICSQSPTPKGVGMPREGYGQQVDKEA